jgi:hypothetical protein
MSLRGEVLDVYLYIIVSPLVSGISCIFAHLYMYYICGLWPLWNTTSLFLTMRTRFKEDPWLGDTPLASQYHSLYNIVSTKEIIVDDVLSQVRLNIRFNMGLTGDKWDSSVSLVED